MTFNKFLNFIKTKITLFFIHIYQLLLALTLIVGLFYIRLLPQVSRDLWQHMNDYQIFGMIIKIWLVLFHIHIIFGFLGLIEKKPAHPFIIRMRFWMESLTNYIIDILVNFYQFVWFIPDIIAEKLFNYKFLPYQCVRLLAKVIINSNYVHIFFRLLLALDLVPRMVFITAFAYDVLIKQHLYYTFLFLPVLLLPLLEKFIIFIFRHFFTIYWEKISSIVQQTEYTTSRGDIVIQCEFIPEFQDSRPYSFPDYEDFGDYFENHYRVLEEVRTATMAYKEWKYDEFPYYHTLLGISVIRLLLLIIVFGLGVFDKLVVLF